VVTLTRKVPSSRRPSSHENIAAEVPVPAGGRRPPSAGRGPAGRGQAGPPSAPWKNVLVAVAGLVVMGVAAASSMLLSSPDDSASVTTSTGKPLLSGSTRKASGSPSASSSGAVPVSGSTAPGRNPFGGGGAATVTAGPITTTAAPTPGPTSAGPTTATGPGPSLTQTAVAPTAATSTITRTTTVTVSASSLYLGLYGWSAADDPLFKVNEVGVSPAVGATFAPNLVYRGRYVAGGLNCANITYKSVAMSLCQGEVLHLA